MTEKSKWVGGLTEWSDGGTTYLSIAFTWKLDEAYSRAVFARACGQRVVAGGPAFALWKQRHKLADVAEIPTKTVVRKDRFGKEKTFTLPADYAGPGEAITRHNPLATFASRGCSELCSFCIVPHLEGGFTLLPDFPVRPILCDNNLSGLPRDFQQHIIRRYQDAGVPLIDANSGFEPREFTQEVYERWRPLVNAGGGPWRFAYDEIRERAECLRVMRMLEGERPKRKRVYVLIGNEPFAQCMQRIREVIDHGCEPHVQPYIKLSASDRQPHARFDWTEQKLRDVARWANGFVWKKCEFDDYDRSLKKRAVEVYDESQGMFL